jgi:hypothetical protein
VFFPERDLLFTCIRCILAKKQTSLYMLYFFPKALLNLRMNPRLSTDGCGSTTPDTDDSEVISPLCFLSRESRRYLLSHEFSIFGIYGCSEAWDHLGDSTGCCNMFEGVDEEFNVSALGEDLLLDCSSACLARI